MSSSTMLRGGTATSGHVQGRTAAFGLIPGRRVCLPVPRRLNKLIVASRSIQAGSHRRGGDLAGAQQTPVVRNIPQATSADKPSFITHTRMICFTGVLVASVFLDRRSAHAATVVPPPVHTTQDRSDVKVKRGVWSAVKSATTAPLHALDRLLFPDEPISFVRAAETFTDSDAAGQAANDLPTQVPQHKQQQQQGGAQQMHDVTDMDATTASTAAAVPPPLTTAAPPTTSSPSATAAEPSTSSYAGLQFDAAALSQLASAAAAASYQKVTAAVAAASSSLAPSWPAESCALSGLSQLSAHLGLAVSDAESARLAGLLVRGTYALAGLLLAAVAWQMAAAVARVNKPDRQSAVRQTLAGGSVTPTPITTTTGTATAAAACDAPEQQCRSEGVLVTDSGVSVEIFKPDESAISDHHDHHDRQETLQGKDLVGPYCIRSARQGTAAATEPTAAVDVESSAVLGPEQVVGPYCLWQKPAMAAAAEVVHEALVAEAAAMRAAAAESQPECELSTLLPAAAAAEKAGQVVQAAEEAAATAEVCAEQQEEEDTGADHDTAQEHAAVDDVPNELQGGEPLYGLSDVLPKYSLEGRLAAEAVTEALIAESAAATAAIAAERANAAAHKIEEVILQGAAHVTAAAAAASTTAAAAAEGGEEPLISDVGQIDVGQSPHHDDDDDVFDDGDVDDQEGEDQNDVDCLAQEAKQAEAAAAMALLGQAASSSGSSEVTGDVSATDLQDLHELIKEAIAAEAAAAAAAAGMAADIDEAELIAEAIAAEAAAEATLAAAAAAESAAAAGSSAGQAAELVKCHLAAPHMLRLHSSDDSSSVSVSWVIPSHADDDASVLHQLTALAAATGHPAIVDISTAAVTDSSNAQEGEEEGVVHGDALDSSDADAFKDEFPVHCEEQQEEEVSNAAATATNTEETAAGAAEPNDLSLADALNIASKLQMQAASSTAVQQTQQLLGRIYLARRAAARARTQSRVTTAAAATAAAESSRWGVFRVDGSKFKKAAAAAAASHLGVSDLALALILARVDAKEKKAASVTTTTSSSSSNGNGSSSDEQPTEAESVTADNALMPSATDEAVAVTPEVAAGVTESTAVAAAAGDDKDTESAPDTSESPEAPVCIAISSSNSSSTFEVPVITSHTNPYAAIADALTNSSSSEGVGFGLADTTNSGRPSSSSAAKNDSSNSTADGSDTFEVPVIIEDSAAATADITESPANTVSAAPVSKPFQTHSTSFNQPTKGFGKGFKRSGNSRQAAAVVVRNQDNQVKAKEDASVHHAQTSSRSSGGGDKGSVSAVTAAAQQPGPQPEDKPVAAAASAADDSSSPDAAFDVDSSSIPVEWISTTNYSSGNRLQRRSGAIPPEVKTKYFRMLDQLARGDDDRQIMPAWQAFDRLDKRRYSSGIGNNRQEQQRQRRQEQQQRWKGRWADDNKAEAALNRQQYEDDEITRAAAAAGDVEVKGSQYTTEQQEELLADISNAADSPPQAAALNAPPTAAAAAPAGEFTRAASTATALVADEVKPDVTDLLSAAAERLEQSTTTADDDDDKGKGAAAEQVGLVVDVSQFDKGGSNKGTEVDNLREDDSNSSESAIPLPTGWGVIEQGISGSSSNDSLPTGWGSSSTANPIADSASDDAGSSNTGNSSSKRWSDVSAELTAELEGELADLLTSAAARLDYNKLTSAYDVVTSEPILPTQPPTQAAAAVGSLYEGDIIGRYIPPAARQTAVTSVDGDRADSAANSQ